MSPCHLVTFCLVVIVLCVATRIHAEPPIRAKALVERALQVHGGAAKLARFGAITWKGNGKFYGSSTPTNYQVVGARQRGDQSLLGVDIEVNGAKVRLVRIINGDKGWQQTNDRIAPLEAEQLAEEKERLFAQWVGSLVPLLDGKCQIELASASEVAGRPADGVRVRAPGHRDLTLYFDRQTGLLCKKETQVYDFLNSKKEVLQETYYESYRPSAGVQVPCRMRVHWNGKPYLEQEMTEARLHETLPDHMFLRPAVE